MTGVGGDIGARGHRREGEAEAEYYADGRGPDDSRREGDGREGSPEGHDADDAAVMAMLCFERLRWPWSLSENAAGHYRAFLAANTGRD